MNYSIIDSILNIADGRYRVIFKNPNGTTTGWFSNQDPSVARNDPNFVDPPASVWQQAGVTAKTNMDAILQQEKKMADINTGPPLTYQQVQDRYVASLPNIVPVVPQSTLIVNNPTHSLVNTTNGVPTTDVWGLFQDSSPALNIPFLNIGIHEYTALGIAGVVVLGFMFTGNRRKGRFA